MGANIINLNYDFLNVIEKLQADYLKETVKYSLDNAKAFHDLFKTLKKMKCDNKKPLNGAVDNRAYYGEINKDCGYVVLSNYNCVAYHYIVLIYNEGLKKCFKVFKLYSDIYDTIDEQYAKDLKYVQHADILLGFTDNITNREYVHRPNLKYFEDNIDTILKCEKVMYFSPILTNDEKELKKIFSYCGYGASTHLDDLKKVHFILDCILEKI